jgi:hypothetical protein
VRRGRKRQIPFKKRKIESDSISGEEDKIRFHFRRGSKHQIRGQKRKKTSDSI